MEKRSKKKTGNADNPLNQPTRYASEDEWRAEATRRFGEDPMKWAFVCPSCGHVARVEDWKTVGAPQECVAFSCVGRWLPNPKQIGQKPGPCNYAGGGLFRLNPILVAGGDGPDSRVFAFADLELTPAESEGKR